MAAEQRILGLRLMQIDVSTSFQPRVEWNEGLAEQYADALTDGEVLPPVVVFGERAPYVMGDGHYRYRAHELAERPTILAAVRPGGLREATLYAVEANTRHGERATVEDRKHAARHLLADPTWRRELSDREIARMAALSPTTVGVLWEEIKAARKHGLTTVQPGHLSDNRAPEWRPWTPRRIEKTWGVLCQQLAQTTMARLLDDDDRAALARIGEKLAARGTGN
jgi:hypothetical protein